MDNLTHTLAGWTLGQTGLKRKTRKGLSALVLGANMPDVDVFLGWVPWAPLATHRGFTHSLVGGVVLMPPMLAALLWLFDKWQTRRGEDLRSELPIHFGWLVGLSYIGTLTHPFLDWQTSYAIQLFSPFNLRWYHADTLFIADVWIWLGLGAAVWLSRRRERAGRSDWQRPALVGFAGLAAYIGMNGIETARAYAAPNRVLGTARPDVMVMSPPPVAFWHRDVIWRHDHAIGRGAYHLFGSMIDDPTHSPPIRDGMNDPLARRVLFATPQLASFRRWSILPMARVVRERCRTVVQFQDARFGNPGVGRLGREVVLATTAPGC